MYPIIKFAIKYRNIVLPVIAIMVFTVGLLTWGQKRYNDGVNDCKQKQQVQQIKAIEERTRIEKEVMHLSDPDLERRLSKWLRD